MRKASRIMTRILVLYGLGALVCAASASLKTETGTPTIFEVAERASEGPDRILPDAALTAVVKGDSSTSFAQLNWLSGNEPIRVDPNRAYPTVVDPPGNAFQPVSYPFTSITSQLAHSSSGIVQLSPGDYSIPVRLY